MLLESLLLTAAAPSPWLLLSDHWELLNVSSLPEIKCCSLEWMAVFSSIYPSTTCKVCVGLELMIACVHSHTTVQMRVRAQCYTEADHSCTLGLLRWDYQGYQEGLLIARGC